MMIKMFYFFNVFSNKINNRVRYRDGFAQIFLLVGMLLVAISLPIATKLVQQNQENRGKAASTASSTYITCTYTCTTWGACNADGSSLSGGTQACTAESKTPTGCTGGTKKVGSTRNCTPTTLTPTQTTTCTDFDYTDWGACTNGKRTRTIKTKSPSGCNGGSPVLSQDCKSNCPTNSSGKANGCTCTSPSQCTSEICHLGVCTAGRKYWIYSSSKCVQTSSKYVSLTACGSSCYSTEADCNTAHNKIKSQKYWFYNGTKCVISGDSYASLTLCSANTRSTCYETEAACTSVNTIKKTYYYYVALTKTCSTTTSYTSVTDCNKAKGVCFSSADKCTSAYSCERLGGTCRSVCGADELMNDNGRGECSPGRCCVTNGPGGSGRNCIIGSIECRSKVLWQCGLDDNSGYTMRDVGKKCIGDGDKIVYWDDVPKNWVADGIAWSNLDPKNGKVMINPGMDLTKYQAELMKLVEEAGPRTRAGVVAAASYLAELFPYKVPYYAKGGTKDDKYQITTAGFRLLEDGTYTADWGTTIKKYKDSNKAGLCCTAFVEWALRTAGYDAGLVGSTENTSIGSSNKTLNRGTNDQQKKAILDTIKPGDLVYKTEGGKIKHVAMIVDIDYASGTVKIAQSSGSKGVNIEYLDIFTLKPKEGTNSKNSFDFYTSIDGYFEATKNKN